MAQRGRPRKADQQKLDDARARAMEMMFHLHQDAYMHLKASLMSTVICTYCNTEGVAPKRDAEGKCLHCHGINTVPDVDRRNWATAEVLSRTSPKPKTVEQTIDVTAETSATEEALQKATPEALAQVEETLKRLGIPND